MWREQEECFQKFAAARRLYVENQNMKFVVDNIRELDDIQHKFLLCRKIFIQWREETVAMRYVIVVFIAPRKVSVRNVIFYNIE